MFLEELKGLDDCVGRHFFKGMMVQIEAGQGLAVSGDRGRVDLAKL